MLPLSLLKTGQGHPMLVELKNGETYNGQLVNCDTWMNIHLREVICTSKISFRVTCRASQAHSILACASTCLSADEPSDQSTEERHNQHMSDNGVSQGVVARSGNGFVEISSSDPESMDTGGNNNKSTSEERDMVSSCREPEKLSGSSMEEAWEDHGCVLWDLAASRNHAELMVHNLILEVLHANLMVKQKRGFRVTVTMAPCMPPFSH